MVSRVTRRVVPLVLVAVLALASVVVIWASTRSSGPATSPGPEGVVVVHVPDLAPAGAGPGTPIDGWGARRKPRKSSSTTSTST